MSVAYVTSDGASAGTGASSVSYSLTPSGSNLVLYVGVTYYGSGSDPTSVTFNGVALTKLNSGQWYDATSRFSIWRLIAPAATTANVVVTFPAGITEYSTVALVYSGVDQTTANRTVAFATGNSGGNTQSLSATSVSGDTVVALAGTQQTTVTITGFTTRQTASTAGDDQTTAADATATSTATSVDFTTVANGIAAGAFALIAASGAPPATPNPRLVQWPQAMWRSAYR